MLGDYAKKNGFANIQIFDVRFIAVTDNVDSADGDYGLMVPIRNIFNEQYARDISIKRRSANRAKSSLGYPIGLCPYGYMPDPADNRRWVIDDEAAEIVREIYQLRLRGESVYQIADILKRKKIVTPSIYLTKKGIRKCRMTNQRGDYLWDKNVVRGILFNQCYTGDVINFKTYTKSFKLKQRLDNPKENWDIHENVHEAIIDRATWEKVQATFQTKQRQPKHVRKNMFAGFLKCANCGANLNYKYTHANPDNHYFSCRNKRDSNGLCGQTHHIRVDRLTEVVTKHISRVTRFANQFEDDFVKLVVDEHYKQIILLQDKNKKALANLRGRERELDIIFENLYEDKVGGKISEERFMRMSAKYEDEQSELSQKIKHLHAIVEEEKNHEMNADGFIKLIRKYTRINKLTPEILREFIDKIVVHHRETINKQTYQKIEIYYKMVGNIDVPDIIEQKQYLPAFGRTSEDNKKEDCIAI